MTRPKRQEMNKPDDAPLTARELSTLRPLRDVFPDLTTWSHKRKRAAKGEAHKTAISIRLSPEVLAFYRAKGPGWQTRIDQTLRAIIAATR